MDIRQEIQQLDRLPSPPALAAELLELTASPDVKISQIAALIERDPALTAKLLKQCNSAAYGLRQKVASVDRATVMLGIKQIKCLALGFLILTDSEMASSQGFDYTLYWKRASVTAVAGKQLIERVAKPKAGDAFVSGLIQDIGVLLLQHIAPAEYANVLKTRESTHKRLHDLESLMLGIDHMEAGACLLEHWALPPAICESVAFHHQPQRFDGDDDTRQLIHAMATASEIANLFCEPDKGGSLDRVLRVCAAYFQLTENAVHDLLEKVGTDAQETAWLFDTTGTESLDYESIRNQAERKLKTLTQTP